MMILPIPTPGRLMPAPHASQALLLLFPTPTVRRFEALAHLPSHERPRGAVALREARELYSGGAETLAARAQSGWAFVPGSLILVGVALTWYFFVDVSFAAYAAKQTGTVPPLLSYALPAEFALLLTLLIWLLVALRRNALRSARRSVLLATQARSLGASRDVPRPRPTAMRMREAIAVLLIIGGAMLGLAGAGVALSANNSLLSLPFAQTLIFLGWGALLATVGFFLRRDTRSWSANGQLGVD